MSDKSEQVKRYSAQNAYIELRTRKGQTWLSISPTNAHSCEECATNAVVILENNEETRLLLRTALNRMKKEYEKGKLSYREYLKKQYP